ncbi:hypothetical protein SEA_PANAMAXUS_79 [Mycobacterium phage Panamaxus]|nr:hypothetical protein SEA_TEXAGE_80 [Mycobacterium phage Texage]AUX82377.1 hypothetical protein SEA_LAMBERT1_82 [Mycobacterium phage Lambert1]AVP42995.1 hypothetical protein SEA_PANAMAXUS_79 [Mycobacterium phage Panamaxus]AWY03613.1 hypothetical protein SEA_HOOKMOUNT_82 [Mycobacterium phage Hookmount]AYR03460.1 hypothetical protein SEA_POPCICLE_82 [Mycobacterium phage Popcicle]AZV00644.1 hypothetical protein SEA_NORBERT_78 [Mycobacterium phage Norbert]QBP32292.1 hypothetical protein SEA_NOE
MEIGNVDQVKAALESFRSMLQMKHDFMEEHQAPDDDEPSCGYATWDERITDYNYELAYYGEQLADAIEKALA